MPFDSYQLTPLAEADLEEIWLYTFREWSLEQASNYIDDVIDAFEGLMADRKRGRPVDIRTALVRGSANVRHSVFD